MGKKKVLSFKELVLENKQEMLQDKQLLERIEKRLETKHLSK
ncbi:FbpB family small basic protein [Fictibacillus barbaricus]|uniref:FbpB family small basic protein n=1 Tax=Fictibacillus barbaricus TaxID=182136 RepID=A0ABS2Z979_9BACL|nr:FbpB family small basic protein [Fictibacillus barbaricus]MBN3544167.1 FbpB family small basic protein [Fictibacillus barbaricus]